MKKHPLLAEQTEEQCPKAESIGSFNAIYNRYVYKVYQKCLSMTNDPEMAKDFTQDIFIKVFVKLDTFQNRSTFSTWLYAISHNYCLDHLRSNRRTEALSDATLKETIEPDYCESMLTQWKALNLFMNTLPDDEATMLRLKYEEGQSVRYISEQYNLSESSVKMRLKRSRDKLRVMCSTAISNKEKHFMRPVAQ